MKLARRGSVLGRGSRLLAATAALLSLLIPLQAFAGPAFPRLAMRWADHHAQSLSSLARYDYLQLENSYADHIGELKAANPNIMLFGSNNGQELEYREDDYDHPINVDARKATVRWALTQVGSRLTANVDANTTVFPVAEVSKSGLTLFAVGDVLVVDDELLKITGISGTNLTVKRGTRMGRPAASHYAGTRIAAVISVWPNSVSMDVTAYCPLVDVGNGPERWTDFNARRLHSTLHSAAWDGIIIDCIDTVESYQVRNGSAARRSIDPDRSNTIVTDYTAFDAAWNTGNLAQAAKIRSLVGPDAIVIPNTGVKAFNDLNGAIFEDFPKAAQGETIWRQKVFGPDLYQRGSYLEWCAARQPQYSSIETYEYEGWLSQNPFGTPGWQPNYQKMRYGLTSALMGDGYFSYEMASNGHGALGLMWFDEYDNAGAGRGYLGWPVSAPKWAMPTPSTPDLLGGDGSFDTLPQLSAWQVYADPGYSASTSIEGGTGRVSITSAAGEAYRLSLLHPVSLIAGTNYTVTFRARADRPLTMRVGLYNWTTTWRSYTAVEDCALDTSWKSFELPLTSSGTDAAAMVRLMLGQQTGNVWIDDFKVQTGIRPRVWRRDFDGGIALVNPTDTAATVELGGTYRKIKGTQVPSVNNGATVSSVLLQPHDGIILLYTSPGTPVGERLLPVYRFYNVQGGTHFYTASATERDQVMATLSSKYRYEGVAYAVNTANPDNNVPLHRFYNMRTGTHFYTASAAEKDAVMASMSSTYAYDGVAYNVSMKSSGQPVFRFFNVSNATHFYTASATERDNVVANAGWLYRYEGPAFYLAP